MQIKALLFPLFILLGLTPVNSLKAASPVDVVINEIAWMGTNTSYSDEWIELYNNTNFPVNLDGWKLKAVDGTPEINLFGIIPANGFFLLERTNDNTVPDIPADWIGSFGYGLNNQGEKLELIDDSGNLIDMVDCSSGWFAGDNKTKQTMERINPLMTIDSSNWQTSKNPEGTPKAGNSILTQYEPEPKESQEPEQKEEEQQTYSTSIIFNEILPSPEGPDAENEWIELFNKNDFDVNLSDWKIKDAIGSITTYTFPKDTIIKNQSYLVVLRPETKITLNNDADSLNLIQPNNEVIDTVSYEKAPRRESYSLTNSGWSWSQELTPGQVNLIKQPKDTKIILKEKSSEIKQDILKEEERMLASVLKETPENSNDFSNVFLIALSIAIFSGIVILILKKIISKKLIFNKE